MSTARNSRRLAKKNPNASKALEALAVLVEDNQKLLRRVERLEYVLTEKIGNAYDLLGTSFGPRLNERYPQVDWEARRKLYEVEYDKQHPDPGEET